MSFFTDPQNKFTIYDVPKGGGTTIRLWIYYAGTGSLEISQNGYYEVTARERNTIQGWGYNLLDGFISVPGERVCIKRDPVKRFISCFKDKVLREKRWSGTVDELLDNYDEVVRKTPAYMLDLKTSYIGFHFDPQTWHLGENRDYYDKVFDLSELSTEVKGYLEGKWGIELPNIKARNSKATKNELVLTEEQIAKVKKFYQVDYDNGWY